MDASCIGNPSLAYGSRATPEPAIGLDLDHKKPSLRRQFSLHLLVFFSLLSSHLRAPFRPP